MLKVIHRKNICSLCLIIGEDDKIKEREKGRAQDKQFISQKTMRTMENTKNKGSLHFVVFKWNGRYIGICKETGTVEETDTREEARRKLINGNMAILNTVFSSKQNLLNSINTRPPLKYLIFFYSAPFLDKIESTRTMLKEKKKSPSNFSSFEKSIPLLMANGCN